MHVARPHKSVILALTCLVQFMVVLDVAIVNVALPSIQRDLDLSQGTLQWIVISYSLLLGGFLLLGGRMADLLGRRRVLVSGLVLFTGASLVAGLGDAAGVVIGARAVQGFGAALMAPAALSILAVTFAEGVERNRALGIFGAVAGTSASIGVIASGLLTDGPGWRWVFFINVPIGIALLVLAATQLPRDAGRDRARRFDAAGAVTVTGGLLALVYALNRGADDGWGATSTLLLFALAAVLLANFVRVERREPEPLVPSTVLRQRPLLISNAMAFFAFGAFFAFIFLGSLFMQQVLGYSPTETGLAWLATSATAFVVAGITGARLVNVFGVRTLLLVAMGCLIATGILLINTPADADYVSDLLPGFVLAGIAIGIAPVTIQIGAFTGVTGSAAGIAAGLVETMREIGGAVAVAAASTVLIGGAVIGAPGSPAARDSLADTFHSAFIVIPAFALLGAVVAAVGFARARVGHADVGAHDAVVETAVPSIVGGSDDDTELPAPAACAAGRPS
jgi:EmrB/QacA subfamily drug resistance transporter